MQDTPLWKPHSSPVHNSSFSSMRLRRPVVDTRELKAWFSLAVQAQAQTQWFLFHRENGLDAGISTSASTNTRIKILLFSCAWAYAFVLQQMKTKYRSGIAQAQGYLPHVVKFDQWKHWIQITSRLNSLKGSDDFACACVRVEFCFNLGHPYYLRLCLGLCLRLCFRR